MKNRIAHILAITSAALLTAHAANAQVTVKDAWVRATVPQQKATGAFMQLSAAKDTKLVSASSPVTPLVEVHEMAMQDNVMRMRQIATLDLPAGKTVELKPGGYHVMFMQLKAPLQKGERVPIVLVFEKAGRISVDMQVEALGAPAPTMPAH